MALYKLVKNSDNTVVQLFKDDQEMFLQTHVHNTGIIEHGWGGWKGQPDQLAFAMSYDVCQNKDFAVENYHKVKQLFSMAAPLELEISSSVIEQALHS